MNKGKKIDKRVNLDCLIKMQILRNKIISNIQNEYEIIKSQSKRLNSKNIKKFNTLQVIFFYYIYI